MVIAKMFATFHHVNLVASYLWNVYDILGPHALLPMHAWKVACSEHAHYQPKTREVSVSRNFASFWMKPWHMRTTNQKLAKFQFHDNLHRFVRRPSEQVVNGRIQICCDFKNREVKRVRANHYCLTWLPFCEKYFWKAFQMPPKQSTPLALFLNFKVPF